MTTSLGRVDSRNSYGAILLILAATAILPGVGMVTGPLAGVTSLVLGVQLAWGKPQPWMPIWLSKRMASSAFSPRLGHWIQERCKPLLHMTFPRFPPFLAGLTVAWSSLLLILPLAFIPFGNSIPSFAVGLVGAGLVAQKSLLGWLGLVLSGVFTLALVLVGEVLFLAAHALFRYLP